MKALLLSVALCGLTALLAGCGDGDSGKLRIAVIPKGTNHSFWKSIHAGANKAASEEGVEVIWQGPKIESEREEQIKVVQDFVVKRVDAITIAPLDDRALIRPLRDAKSEDMKVVIFDSGLDESGNDAWDSFVATDNYAAGVSCGKKLAELMDGKGKVILLRHLVGSASTQKRADGFVEGIKKHAPDIVFLSDDQYAGATVETSIKAAENLLNQYGDEVEGIFVPNESATEGMMAALKNAGLAGKVKFVGFDGNENIIKGIEEGTLDAVCLQDPFNMGYLAVKHAVALLKDEKVEKIVDTGSMIVTKENLKETRTQELINPPLEKWLDE